MLMIKSYDIPQIVVVVEEGRVSRIYTDSPGEFEFDVVDKDDIERIVDSLLRRGESIENFDIDTYTRRRVEGMTCVYD